jgi:hypothetical protein
MRAGGKRSRPDPRSGLDEEGRFTPAFPGQRPPFEPGHELSVRHGFYASPLLRPDDREEVAAIEVNAWALLPEGLQLDRYRLAVEGLACRIWQARRAYADLAEHGLVRGPDRQPAPILRYLGTLERTIQRDLEGLGLTPRAAAELGLDLVRAKGEALRAHLAEHYDRQEG